MPDQTFYFKLETLSPIHLGCGEVYEPTAFVVDEKEMALVHFGPSDFISRLPIEDLGKFSDICKKGTPYSLVEIYKFINARKHLAEGEEIAISPAFVGHYKKTLNLSEKDNINNEINKFKIERTAFHIQDGTPYIPGSAIKGAIRTAVLNARNQKKPQSSGKAAQVEASLLGGTFAEDPFTLVKVSDFVPVSEVRRRIVYGVIRKKEPSRYDARGPAQLLEIIEPKMQFWGCVTLVENRFAKRGAPVTKDEIEKALSAFYGKEQERENSEMDQMGCNFSISLPPDSRLIRLGRHSGAECLTLDGLRKIKILQGKGMPPKTLPHATTLWLASPQSKPTANAGLQAFGWASLSVLSEAEAQEIQDALTRKRETALKQEMEILREKQAEEEKSRLLALKAAEDKARADAEEEKRREEEARYPWRKFLPALEAVQDWGALKQKALEHAELKSHQAEPEVGQAVKTAAIRVRDQYPKKWTPERDEILTDWLTPSGAGWEETGAVAHETRPENAISGLKSWEDYKASGLVIESLSEPDAKALRRLFKDLKLDRAPKKEKKAEWERLKKHLASLRGSHGDQ